MVVDPKGRDFSKYRGATIIKPNLQEAEQAINQKIYSEESLLQAGRVDEYRGRQYGADHTGAQGMSIFQKGASGGAYSRINPQCIRCDRRRGIR